MFEYALTADSQDFEEAIDEYQEDNKWDVLA